MAYNYDFGKLDENGGLIYAPATFGNEHQLIMTTEPEIYLEHGYKQIVRTESPVKEGFYYTSRWVEHETTIETEWDEHEQPPEPEPVLNENEQALNALLGIEEGGVSND